MGEGWRDDTDEGDDDPQDQYSVETTESVNDRAARYDEQNMKGPAVRPAVSPSQHPEI
jgi:hypothetical protein